MTEVVVDLLPRDAELARRAAGGDGAAFVRLYDKYSDEVFEASLTASGCVEAAAEATQIAFLRVLRWPPALGAADDDVAELLFALAFGGATERPPASPDTSHARDLARMVGVSWLRSETVAKAGARFDADWSVHVWPETRAPAVGADADAQVEVIEIVKPRRRFTLPRIALPSPAMAVAVVVLTLLGGALGTLLTSGGSNPSGATPSAATHEQPNQPRQSKRKLAMHDCPSRKAADSC
jgi:hypothetical protein